MTGEYPAVGLLVFVNKPFYETMAYVLEPLKHLLPTNVWWLSRGAYLQSRALLGGKMCAMRSINQEVSEMATVHIEFDEEDVVRLSQTTNQSFEQLFMPYIQGAKAVPGVLAVGIGFELSSPSNPLAETVQEAGVAVLFDRDEKHKSWSRHQTMPLVGHGY